MKNLIKVSKTSIIIYISIIISIGLSSCKEDEELAIQGPSISYIEPASSFAGTEVTIFGTNFRTSITDNTVTFNGSEAKIIAATGLSLTVIVPESASSGEVTVTTNGFTSAGTVFTVDVPIIPTITSIDPESGEIGDIVTITGTNFSSEPNENIVSFNGGIATVSSSTETTITVEVPATASTGNVTVTRDGASNGVLFTVTTPIVTLIVPLSVDEDDVEEGALNGAMALTSSDLEFGEYDTWTQDGIEQGLQTIGVRFNDITIPASSNILSASIQFTADNIGANPVQFTIYGENVGNATPYLDEFYNLTSRAKTDERVVWDVPEWIEVGDAGEAQKTNDLSSLVREIINRSDWSSGNSINFIMQPSGPSIGVTSNSGGREAEAGVGSDSPTLTIIYQE